MDPLNKILAAKEKRLELRRRIAKKKLVSLSLSLNIPGFPKSSEKISQFFRIIWKDLKRFLTANRVFLVEDTFHDIVDDAGNFIIAGIQESLLSIMEIKDICERFEENVSVGRLVDVDITSVDLKPVSSGKAKSCYICGDIPALICMREGKHDVEELRDYVFRSIQKFIEETKREETCRTLARLAIKSILYEVSLTPKPGAVDRLNPGSHDDMDFITFMNSSAALSPFFYRLAELGYNFSDKSSSENNVDLNIDLSNGLSLIREIGLQMESDMFGETEGINTQKGIIFLMGVSLFSAGYVIRIRKKFILEEFKKTIMAVTRGITDNELSVKGEKKSLTHGEECFKRFGKQKGAGVRHEVERGLPTVMSYGLPTLEKSWQNNDAFVLEADIKGGLTRTLVSIMSVNNDSNILFRAGADVSEKVKQLSASVLECNNGDKWESTYQDLIKYCIEKNISPGGSADLLAITVFLYFVNRQL